MTSKSRLLGMYPKWFCVLDKFCSKLNETDQANQGKGIICRQLKRMQCLSFWMQIYSGFKPYHIASWLWIKLCDLHLTHVDKQTKQELEPRALEALEIAPNLCNHFINFLIKIFFKLLPWTLRVVTFLICVYFDL